MQDLLLFKYFYKQERQYNCFLQCTKRTKRLIVISRVQISIKILSQVNWLIHLESTGNKILKTYWKKSQNLFFFKIVLKYECGKYPFQIKVFILYWKEITLDRILLLLSLEMLPSRKKVWFSGKQLFIQNSK